MIFKRENAIIEISEINFEMYNDAYLVVGTFLTFHFLVTGGDGIRYSFWSDGMFSYFTF